MKYLTTTICALAAGILLAADAVSGASTNAVTALTPEMRKARARMKMYQRTGGWVRRPGTGRGKCVFVNTQKRVPAEPIAQAAANVSKMVRVDVECSEGKPVTVQTASMGVLLSGGQAAVFVVDDAALPALLVAPESRWAMVNVAPLMADKAPEAMVATRVMRECSRAFAQLLGSGNSSVPAGCTLRPVNSLRDLDALTADCFGPEPIDRIVEHMETLGITPYTATIYRTACQQGWAPSPTDDVQRVIWEKTRADKERGPTNPITIQPPKAKK